ncbi:DUF6177 family protein [Agrococcus baldri]|uniref:Uncharacterized protein n=1 Tax=Agrococcus baldri TaxID=153730 RepID=A0AA87UTA9_9MICO|nr:DUF6177 family protein [Agrococcus baldri]GEK81479.1 hypothetical protein ABA31_28300 [Agrococcus baldri]
MQYVHPVADEWTDQYALYAPSSRQVLRSAPVGAFLDYCREEGLRPVLLTGEHASVSPLLSLAMGQAGGHWAMRTADGTVYDAVSGYRITAFEDLWLDGSTDRPRHPAFEQTSRTDTIGVLTFDVYVHHSAVAETRIGPVVEHMLAGLGGATPTAWGHVEPLARRWSIDDLTMALRPEMPQSSAIGVAATRGGYSELTVGRTRRGLLERVRGGVPVGSFDPDDAETRARAWGTLESLSERFRPTVAFASYAETEPGGARPAAKNPEQPLGVYLGPRAVRDLALDFDTLQAQYDLVRLGRDRVPGALLRLSGSDPLWHQLVAFSFDLDRERLVEAVRPEIGG